MKSIFMDRDPMDPAWVDGSPRVTGAYWAWGAWGGEPAICWYHGGHVYWPTPPERREYAPLMCEKGWRFWGPIPHPPDFPPDSALHIKKV